jgi:predicted regulator of Ras-like GTPase activity (Roadblock/LC7/MglB family)
MSAHAETQRRGIFRRQPRDDAQPDAGEAVAPPLPRRTPDPARARIGTGFSPQTSALRLTQVAAEPPAWAVGFSTRLPPILDGLVAALGGPAAALVATQDGMAVSSSGLAADEAHRLASLSGSLYAVCGATARLREGGGADAAPPVDSVTFGSERRTTVVLAVGDPGHGGALLVVTADEVNLGVLLVEARRAAAEAAELIAG